MYSERAVNDFPKSATAQMSKLSQVPFLSAAELDGACRSLEDRSHTLDLKRLHINHVQRVRVASDDMVLVMILLLE